MISVFYLDDDALLCKIFKESFQKSNIEVTTFTDADDAINAAQKNPPSIFFIDFQLINTDGNQVAKAVDASIPKILVTGDLQSSPTKDFQGVISKPYDLSLVQSLIDAFR